MDERMGGCCCWCCFLSLLAVSPLPGAARFIPIRDEIYSLYCSARNLRVMVHLLQIGDVGFSLAIPPTSQDMKVTGIMRCFDVHFSERRTTAIDKVGG